MYMLGMHVSHVLACPEGVLTRLDGRLFGLTAHQTYRYFRLYPSDRPSIKSFVSNAIHSISFPSERRGVTGHSTSVSLSTSSWRAVADCTALLSGLDIIHTITSIHVW